MNCLDRSVRSAGSLVGYALEKDPCMRFSSFVAAIAIVFSGAIASAQQYNIAIYSVSWTVMQDPNYSVTVIFDQDREQVRLRELRSFGETLSLTIAGAVELSQHLMNVEAYIAELDRANSPESLRYTSGDAYLTVSKSENGGRNIFVGRSGSFGGVVSI